MEDWTSLGQHKRKPEFPIVTRGGAWWAAVYGVTQSWFEIGEGNGNPLLYSCLENPVDKGPGGLLSIITLMAESKEELRAS